MAYLCLLTAFYVELFYHRKTCFTCMSGLCTCKTAKTCLRACLGSKVTYRMANRGNNSLYEVFCSLKRCAVLSKFASSQGEATAYAAAREMRPLDKVLTNLASLRVGCCTAVQLGRVCDTSACPQSGNPRACNHCVM